MNRFSYSLKLLHIECFLVQIEEHESKRCITFGTGFTIRCLGNQDFQMIGLTAFNLHQAHFIETGRIERHRIHTVFHTGKNRIVNAENIESVNRLALYSEIDLDSIRIGTCGISRLDIQTFKRRSSRISTERNGLSKLTTNIHFVCLVHINKIECQVCSTFGTGLFVHFLRDKQLPMISLTGFNRQETFFTETFGIECHRIHAVHYTGENRSAFSTDKIKRIGSLSHNREINLNSIRVCTCSRDKECGRTFEGRSISRSIFIFHRQDNTRLFTGIGKRKSGNFIQIERNNIRITDSLAVQPAGHRSCIIYGIGYTCNLLPIRGTTFYTLSIRIVIQVTMKSYFSSHFASRKNNCVLSTIRKLDGRTRTGASIRKRHVEFHSCSRICFCSISRQLENKALGSITIVTRQLVIHTGPIIRASSAISPCNQRGVCESLIEAEQ